MRTGDYSRVMRKRKVGMLCVFWKHTGKTMKENLEDWKMANSVQGEKRMNNTARRGRGVWCGSEAKRR